MGFKKPNTNVTAYVTAPGYFHVIVKSIEENPVYDGQQKDQVNIGVSVLAGTDPSQVRHETMLRLNNPNEGQKDGGEFCAKVQTRAAIAMDLPAIITDSQSGERVYCEVIKVPDDAEMDLDWIGGNSANDPENVPPWSIGKQFIVKLREEEYQGKKSIKLDGACIYHVTDPDVAEVPKDFKALELGGYKVKPPTGKTEPKPAAAGAAKPAGNGAAGAKTTAAAGNGGTKQPAAAASGGVAGGAKPPAKATSNYDDL